MKTKSLNTSALATADSPKGRTAVQLFRAQYDKARLPEDAAQRLNEHPDFAKYLTEGIRRFSVKAPDYALAQSILGADFITPEEIIKVRSGVVYTGDQITALTENLPAEDVLKWCKENGYAVMPAPPTAMSLLEVRGTRSDHFYAKTGGWYADQKFAREDKTSPGWLMIKKVPVPNSNSKNWDEQGKLLSALERVPNAAEMSWFITTYFEVRGVRLFENIYVRTSSVCSGGSRVLVGVFVAEGLRVDLYWDSNRRGLLGVSAARK